MSSVTLCDRSKEAQEKSCGNVYLIIYYLSRYQLSSDDLFSNIFNGLEISIKFCFLLHKEFFKKIYLEATLPLTTKPHKNVKKTKKYLQ